MTPCTHAWGTVGHGGGLLAPDSFSVVPWAGAGLSWGWAWEGLCVAQIWGHSELLLGTSSCSLHLRPRPCQVNNSQVLVPLTPRAGAGLCHLNPAPKSFRATSSIPQAPLPLHDAPRKARACPPPGKARAWPPSRKARAQPPSRKARARPHHHSSGRTAALATDPGPWHLGTKVILFTNHSSSCSLASTTREISTQSLSLEGAGKAGAGCATCAHLG